MAAVLDEGVDCASVVADAVDEAGDAASDVVAHATPATVMMAAAATVASFPGKEFIAHSP